MKALLPLTAILAALALVGCSSEPAASSTEEVKSFKGGPMPQEFKDKLAAQQSKNAGGPPAGTPTGG